MCIVDRINELKSIQIVKNSNEYNEKLQKFENEIDFQIDGIIQSIQLRANKISIQQKEW